MISSFMSLATISFANFITPLIFICIAVPVLLALRYVASRYKKIPPGVVGIFYGRTTKGADDKKHGFRLVAGGGGILYPFVESYDELITSAFQVSINEQGIPNKDNVKINVHGVATCKISTLLEDLYNAAENFLGKSPQEINAFIENILRGHLRSIIGGLAIDDILRRRDEFNKNVVQESQTELKKIGVEIVTLVIQDVGDDYGYIDILGKKTVAEATRDANIKVAEADAETKKKTSAATRDADIEIAANAVKVNAAQRDRDIQIAGNKILVDTESAKADMAKAIQTAEQEKMLKVKQADRDAAEREAQIKVQQKEALRKEAELNATVVQIAIAQKQQQEIIAEQQKRVAIINAEAQAEAQIKAADGVKMSAIARAEGESQSARLQGEGEAAQSLAIANAKATGDANIQKQALMAVAEGNAAQVRMKLEAEAAGTLKLAEALKQLTNDAKLIMILDRLPQLIEKGGEAGSKVATAIFGSLAAPFGSIDNITITDFGGSGNALSSFGDTVPKMFGSFMAKLNAMGIDSESLFKKVGIDISAIKELVGKNPQTIEVPAAPPAPEDEKPGKGKK